MGSERRIGGTLDRPGDSRPENDQPGYGRLHNSRPDTGDDRLRDGRLRTGRPDTGDDRPINSQPENGQPDNGRAWLAGAGVAGVLLVIWFFVAWLGLRRNAVDAAGESVGSGFVLLCLAVLIGVIRANGRPDPAARHLPGPVSPPAPRR